MDVMRSELRDCLSSYACRTSLPFSGFLAETIYLARFKVVIVGGRQHVRNHRFGTIREIRVLVGAFIQLFNDW